MIKIWCNWSCGYTKWETAQIHQGKSPQILAECSWQVWYITCFTMLFTYYLFFFMLLHYVCERKLHVKFPVNSLKCDCCYQYTLSFIDKGAIRAILINDQCWIQSNTVQSQRYSITRSARKVLSHVCSFGAFYF